MTGPVPDVSDTDALRAAVLAQLSRVTDPELDEPVTKMGFVSNIGIIGGGDVHVAFRLPTYWCSPNFAYMMGEDMRAAVLSLPWVGSVTVTLCEHLSADEINRGVNGGLPFDIAFGDQATGNLDELRATFLRKAFQWRQEALLRHLLGQGYLADELLVWTVSEIGTAQLDLEGAQLMARYLDRRAVAGNFDGGSPAFVNVSGEPLDAASLPQYLRSLRRLRTNAEFNSALCRGLLAERFSYEPLPPRRDAYIEPAARAV